MRAAFSVLIGSVVLLASGAADAGGSGSPSCNCTTPTPPACNSCGASSGSASMTHTVTVPGVYVTPPSVYVAPSRLVGGVGGTSGASAGAGAESGVASDISVSVQASANSSTAASLLAAAASNSSALSQTSALATANSQAANLLAASGGASGGGGSFFEGGGSGGNIPNLTVTTPGAASSTRQVCARTAVVAQAVAVQAVCLDDKDVPHPASQTLPGQDVPEGYSGELFRCIAGAHMQYITAAYAGEARFDHGQTVVCAKGEALWRDAGGRLQCRPQTPARDCNERSLLRRYGAGIKVLKAAVAGQCVEWRTETVQAEAASQGSLQLDGGVGG